MIKITPSKVEMKANCDSCGNDIPVSFGTLDDHLQIGGYHNGKLLEAIVCIKCMEEKFKFVNIQKKENTIGYC